MNKAIEVKLNNEDKILMENILSVGNIEHKFAVRLQTVLHRANGESVAQIAKFLLIHRNSVTNYINQYNNEGFESLVRNKTKKPGKKPISEEIKNKVIDIACHKKPENATHWSTRALAKETGISHNAASKILRAANVKPHIQSYYSYSNDPEFETKLRDVAGLYMNPPENAIIFCIDEKTGIQALERTQHALFPQSKLPAHQSNDYIRHGTTTLFAALNYLTGNVIGECKQHHKADDYLSFIKKLDRKCPKDKVLHIISDNYKTHYSQKLKDYMSENPGRFVLHFTPTHSSWLNLIERWFRDITCERIRRESWNSLDELIKAIKSYIKGWNKSNRKFVWSKAPDEIIRKINKRKTYHEHV